jgi:hypothetical protein
LDYYGKWFCDNRTNDGLLEIGHSGPHVANIISGLLDLRYGPLFGDAFTDKLASVVKQFQTARNAKNQDGKVGRGTRRLLVNTLLEPYHDQWFKEPRLKPTFAPFYQVFLSYAWADTDRVNLLDQWLRDHNLSVLRDTRDFQVGQDLKDEITTNLNLSDKVVAVVTANSQGRDWPAFERNTTERIEKNRGVNCLIYLLLDAEPPKHDPNRINIRGTGKPLKEIGEAILNSVTGSHAKPVTFPYDEARPI